MPQHSPSVANSDKETKRSLAPGKECLLSFPTFLHQGYGGHDGLIDKAMQNTSRVVFCTL
jgi:hypothetical protein